MREGASEAVEAPYDEGVALVELGQGPAKARSRPGRADRAPEAVSVWIRVQPDTLRASSCISRC